jgi:hypothetical protein
MDTRFRSRLIAIVAACAILTGCDDGPTAPRAVLQPTPLPVPNVVGNWQGHSHTAGSPYLCGSDTPASATFSQDGSRVTGRVRTQTTAGVRLEREFQGELRGPQLTGTLTANGTTTNVSGGASATHINMRFGASSSLFCGMTTISLDR